VVVPHSKYQLVERPFGLTVPLIVAVDPVTAVAAAVVTRGRERNLNEAILVFLAVEEVVV